MKIFKILNFINIVIRFSIVITLVKFETNLKICVEIIRHLRTVNI